VKNILFILLFLAFATFVHGQEKEENVVSTSPIEIQVGLLGIWMNKEYKLADQFAIRTEVGLDSEISAINSEDAYIMYPVFTAEPRWYYNFKKRSQKGKKTTGNFGNFVSLKSSFHPDLFVISNYYESIVPDLSIVPTWGIRRPISESFSFEAGIGLGYIFYFYKTQGYTSNEGELAANIHLRFGYRF